MKIENLNEILGWLSIVFAVGQLIAGNPEYSLLFLILGKQCFIHADIRKGMANFNDCKFVFPSDEVKEVDNETK